MGIHLNFELHFPYTPFLTPPSTDLLFTSFRTPLTMSSFTMPMLTTKARSSKLSQASLSMKLHDACYVPLSNVQTYHSTESQKQKEIKRALLFVELGNSLIHIHGMSKKCPLGIQNAFKDISAKYKNTDAGDHESIIALTKRTDRLFKK